jgi:hypothetical protein
MSRIHLNPAYQSLNTQERLGEITSGLTNKGNLSSDKSAEIPHVRPQGGKGRVLLPGGSIKNQPKNR